MHRRFTRASAWSLLLAACPARSRRRRVAQDAQRGAHRQRRAALAGSLHRRRPGAAEREGRRHLGRGDDAAARVLAHRRQRAPQGCCSRFCGARSRTQGQIFGNQAQGSVARVTNGLAFSYPGYNEMSTGLADPRINTNEFGPNPNVSVFEWLNGLPELHGRVARLRHLGDVQGHLQREAQPPADAGRLRSAVQGDAHARDGSCSTSSAPAPPRARRRGPLRRVHAGAAARLVRRSSQPRVLFVGYGETDNWAHAGRYDLVLHSAHAVRPVRRGAVEHPAGAARSTRTRPRSSSPPTTAAAAA